MTALLKDEVIALVQESGMVVIDDRFSILPFLERFAHNCRADLIAEIEAFDKAENSFMRKAIELEAELAALRSGSDEPVAIFKADSDGDYVDLIPHHGQPLEGGAPLYTHPQPSAVPVVRELVGSLRDLTAWFDSDDVRSADKHIHNGLKAITKAQQWLKDNT